MFKLNFIEMKLGILTFFRTLITIPLLEVKDLKNNVTLSYTFELSNSSYFQDISIKHCLFVYVGLYRKNSDATLIAKFLKNKKYISFYLKFYGDLLGDSILLSPHPILAK